MIELLHSKAIKKCLLGVLFLLVFYCINVLHVTINEPQHNLPFFYILSLPLLTSFFLYFKSNSLPAIIIVLACGYFQDKYQALSYLHLLSILLAAGTSTLIYYFLSEKKHANHFWYNSKPLIKISTIICLNSLMGVFYWQVVTLQLTGEHHYKYTTIRFLVDYMSLCNSCLLGVPFFSFLFSSFQKNKRALRFITSRSFPSTNIKSLYIILFSASILSSIYLYMYSLNLPTSFLICWYLPLLIWLGVTYSNVLMLPVWLFVSLGTTFELNKSTYDIAISNLSNSAVISLFTASVLLVSSCAFIWITFNTSRISSYIHHLKYISKLEPNTKIPSLLALKEDISRRDYSYLCLINLPEVAPLSHIYGISLRFNFITSLRSYLLAFLHHGEDFYYIQGYGVVITFKQKELNRIDVLNSKIKEFRFTWNNEVKLGLCYGIVYTNFIPEKSQVSLLIGELHKKTTISMQTGTPLLHVPAIEQDKYTMGKIRHRLQQSIDQHAFMLFVQPIVSTKDKKTYYEVLMRMKGDDGETIFPDTFLPLASNAGLLTDLDMVIIEQTFKFMGNNNTCEKQSFSINLMPSTLYNSNFMSEIKALFESYQVNPRRIIFEIIEADVFDMQIISPLIQELRTLGCRIAIDDFGTGHSSYSRLKALDVDILKIDGSFIRNILVDEFDFHATKSFYAAAKLKNLDVVAEFVENQKIQDMLTQLGVEWLQGFHTGKPFPIENISTTNHNF